MDLSIFVMGGGAMVEWMPMMHMLFYFPGGFDYEKMSVPSKLMMKMFIKTLRAKKDKTEAEEEMIEMIEMISGSYDISDKKYIRPILEYLKG